MFLLLLKRITQTRLSGEGSYWGCLGGWQETQPEQVTSNDQKNVPDHMTSRSVHKVRGREKRKEHLKW